MIDRWVAAEGPFFAAVLFIVIAVVAVIEGIAPRRILTAPKGLRWSGNILINVIDVLTVRAIIPLLTVGMAVLAAERNWGLLNQLPIPISFDFIIAVLVIDSSRYAQHYLMHNVTLLWRLHLVHHTDQDYDFSTSLRFHPLESLFTTGFDVVIILLLGPPIIAVLIYETIKVTWAIVAHANINIPLPVDRALRKILVTPDIHRIHHSASAGETNSNYSSITPVWDKLFGTYIDQPVRGHTGMTIGLPDYQQTTHLKLGTMLVQPFRSTNLT